jgi:uncharacterized protein YndB with AHSA1/START domain
MTGSEGDQSRGYWEIVEVDAPDRLLFRDGFANADSTANSDMPLNQARVTIAEIGEGRTWMTFQSIFPDAAAMERLIAMRMEEGLKQAVGQIDAIIAADIRA